MFHIITMKLVALVILQFAILCYLLYCLKDVRALENECKIAIATIYDARNWIRSGIDELCIPAENIHEEVCRLCGSPDIIHQEWEKLCRYVEKTFRKTIPNEQECMISCILSK